MFADFAVQCTWEGDNTILSLQSGRSLVSSWNDAIRGKKLAPGVAYLSTPDTLTAKSSGGSLDLQDIDKGWACIAANVVKKAAEDYAAFLKDGKSKNQAMEMCSQSRFIAAKMHTIGYVSVALWFKVASLTPSRCRSSACSSKRVTACLPVRRRTCSSSFAGSTVCGRWRSREHTS
jgi:hypothetical protein